MKWLRVLLLTSLMALLQISLMGSLRIGGIVPNLVLILVVCLTIWGTASESLLAAVWGGLVLDVAGGGVFGLAMSSLVVLALFMVAARQRGVDGHAWPVRLGLVAVGSLLWGVIHVASLGFNNFLMFGAWWIIIAEIAVNGGFSLLYRERWVYGARQV